MVSNVKIPKTVIENEFTNITWDFRKSDKSPLIRISYVPVKQKYGNYVTTLFNGTKRKYQWAVNAKPGKYFIRILGDDMNNNGATSNEFTVVTKKKIL